MFQFSEMAISENFQKFFMPPILNTFQRPRFEAKVLCVEVKPWAN